MRERILSLLCILALCLGMLPATAWAAGDAEITDWSDPSQNDNEELQVGWSAQGNFDIDWYTEGPNTADEYVLYDAADLAGLAVIVNGAYKVKGNEDWYNVSMELGNGGTPATNGSAFKLGEDVQDDFAGKTIVLAANTTFNLSGDVWVPIGYGENFRGTFEGNSENGTTITGMTIQSTAGSVGLFGQAKGATIQNVAVENASITAKLEGMGSIDGRGAGGILGYTDNSYDTASDGLVANCTFSGTIEVTESGGYTSVGGIVGHLEGSAEYGVTVENCVSFARITGRGNYIGGVAGWDNGYASITGCRNEGEITPSGGAAVGGIIGYTRGDVTDCVNNGALTWDSTMGNGNRAFGGVAGMVRACTLEGCVNNGKLNVTATGIDAAGGSGQDTGDGSLGVDVDDESGVDNPTHGIYVGGVAGLVLLYSETTDTRESDFADCHNRADVSGYATTYAGTVYLGGVLGGMLRWSSRDVDILRCSNAGDLTAGADRASIVGGLVGFQSVTGAYRMTVSQCYNAGAVTIDHSSAGNYNRAGGLMGSAGGTTLFEDCYNVGDVKYTANEVKDAEHSFYLGGLAGKIDVAATGSTNIGSATFTRCYNAGTVDANSQKGAGIGGVVGGLESRAAISVANTSCLTGCVTNAGETPVNASGAPKSANEMTEDYTWATGAYLGLGETNWEKQANDLTDKNNLIGYLPVLKNNKQDPAPQLPRTVAEKVTVTITGAPDAPASMSDGPIMLTATVTGGTYQTLYWTTGSDAVATVSGSGSPNATGTVTITGPGTTVITAVAYDDSNQIVGSGFVTLEVHGSPVSAVTLSGLTAPVQGAQPVSSASVASTAYYTLDDFIWEGVNSSIGLFEYGKEYTAVFTLSPKAGCSFESAVDVTLAGMLGDETLQYNATATQSGDDLIVRVTFDSLPHTHKWASYWSTDGGDYHWHNCLNAGCDITDNSQKDGYAAHGDKTYLWRDDGKGGHYLKCYTCGAAYGTEEHSSTTWLVDTQTNQHYQICDTCGKIFNQGEHVADTTQWLRSTDDNGNGYHYHACTSCGAEMDLEAHEFKTDDTLVGGDYRYWQKSESEHWRICNVCGEFDRAAHENGYVEDNALTHSVGCPVCGRVTGDRYLPHVDEDGDRVCDQCGASIGYAVSFYDSDGTLIKTVYTGTDGKLAADSWPAPGNAPEGQVFIGWYNTEEATGGTRYTADSKFNYRQDLYPRWGDYHTVTVEETENGTVAASKTTQLVMNDTVTLTVSPADGYRLTPDTLIVTNLTTNNPISSKEQPDGTYTFAMPDADVKVSAQFEARPALYFVDPPQYIFMGSLQSVSISYEGTGYVNLSSSDTDVATVYWITTGKRLSINPQSPGTVTITATSDNAPSITDFFTLEVCNAVSAASITGLTAPVQGATPVMASALNVPADGGYTVTGLVWEDENGEAPTGTFAENTAYTAVITLQAQQGYRFRDTAWANVDGKRAGSYEVSEDGKTMTVRVTFSKTGHVHQWSDWINAGYQHYRQCTVSGCSEMEFAVHTVSGDALWMSDALYHYHTCSDCGGACDTAYHAGEGGEFCQICNRIIGYEITLNPNGGTCATTKVYTNTYGYLDGSDLPIPTNGGLPFSGWYTAETGGSLVTGQYRLQSDTVLYARWGEARQYAVIVTASPTEGGTVTASAEQAEANTTVSLTVTPATGYRLKTLSVRDADGNNVTVNNYQFTMPASNVTVAAEFEFIDGTAFTILGLPQRTIYAGDSFRLTASGGSGSGTVTWTSSAESVATVDSGGNVRAVGTGNVTITARRGGETAQVSFTVSGQAIDAVTILNLKAPVQGEIPSQTILVPVDAHYGSLTQMGVGGGNLDVIWKDSTGATVANTAFTANQVYTAVITLQAKDGYTFGDQVAVTLESLQESAYSTVSAERNAAGQLVVTVAFNATDHTHDWDTEWSSDPLHHWHKCLADGCPALTSGMKDYGYHTDADGDGVCDVCGAEIGYTVTFDAGGGKVEPADTRTDTYGQLTIPLPTPTGGSGTFTGWFLADGTQVTQSSVFSADTTVYARWYTPNGGSGTTTYSVTVAETEHGTVTASPKNAAKGATVTITAVPDEGYELAGLAVTDKDGNELALTDIGGGKFTFQMPGGKVTVEAAFRLDYAHCFGAATCPMAAFSDVDMTAWYHDGVHYCLAEGLMVGISDTTFAPQGTTSRAMIVTVLWRLAGSPVVDYAMDFDDVPQDQWYSEAVRWAASQGIVDGYDNGSFGPEDPITREQLAVMLYRYVQSGGGGFTGMWAFPLDYADADEVSDWAYEALCWMTMHGVIQGTGDGSTLSPLAGASRAEAATMLQRFLTEEAMQD